MANPIDSAEGGTLDELRDTYVARVKALPPQQEWQVLRDLARADTEAKMQAVVEKWNGQ
jgi:hypothetical protein